MRRKLIIFITTGAYSGYSPIVPGTAGTAAAILFYLPFARFNVWPGAAGSPWFFPLVYILITAIVSVVGIYASNDAEEIFGKKDPGKVVIDEVAGFFVTMFLLPFTWQWLLAGFFVFRIFDVWKPWPADGLQKLKGGLGIVIDDLIAGVYSCIVLHLIRLGLAYYNGA